MNTHTSLKLSQWLQERGFEGESEMYWAGHGYYRTEIFEHTWHLTKENKNGEKDRAMTGDYGAEADLVLVSIPAYDLIWDICVKYGKEVFGEDYNLSHGGNGGSYIEEVLDLLQQNKTEEAEQYIMKHSIL